MKYSTEDLEKLYTELGSFGAVARHTGMDRRNVARRLRKQNPGSEQIATQGQSAEIQALKAQVRDLAKERIDAEYVRSRIFGLSKSKVEVPNWLIERGRRADDVTGTPTLFASDWHWGEVVDPEQINGVNKFDLEIARSRAQSLINKTIFLLRDCMAKPSYPGIVFALGGDMVSGDIHEELMATNDAEIMPVLVDLFGVLIWCITTLADEFGRVFVPCVSGNHGRNTKKIRAKGRNYTSFDWLLYTMLEKHFLVLNDDRVEFLIPDGPDAYYRVYGHRFLLTHGDQFRGGDGLIGCLGPIIRGDHKKRSRNAQIGMAYDTMLLGHFHQYIHHGRVIVNGSLKGMCEYSFTNNFGYERPQQALWINHPEHGITFAMPVRPEANQTDVKSEWVSVFRQEAA